MKVFQVIYDYCEDDTKKITREQHYQTGCWISICEAAIRHAEEYAKELVSITDVLTVTQQLETGLSYYPVEDEEQQANQQLSTESEDITEYVQGE